MIVTQNDHFLFAHSADKCLSRPPIFTNYGQKNFSRSFTIIAFKESRFWCLRAQTHSSSSDHNLWSNRLRSRLEEGQSSASMKSGPYSCHDFCIFFCFVSGHRILLKAPLILVWQYNYLQRW